LNKIDDFILQNIATALGSDVTSDLVASYASLVSRFRKGDTEAALVSGGKFVEHTLRAIEGLRTGAVPAEIKSPSGTIREIEKDTKLGESVRLLIPRVAYAMIYEVRSKRGAVHVKGIDPTAMDAALTVNAASWIMAELLRLYHSTDDSVVAAAVTALSRGHIPFVETFEGESVVTRQVSCDLELLLLLANAGAGGANRKEIGISSKYSSSTVTRIVQKLEGQRYVHKSSDGKFHITGPGSAFMAAQLSAVDHVLPTKPVHGKPKRRAKPRARRRA